MKVIKRDGHTVTYDRSKIITAIKKANAEVEPGEKVTDEKIEEIVQGIESKNRPRMLVEDIQDIIEQKLMADGKFVLAKTYIIYRYTRELVRKANTTDDSILSLIKNRNKDVMEENSNKNATVASTQRDLIAGEVSKDLTRSRNLIIAGVIFVCGLGFSKGITFTIGETSITLTALAIAAIAGILLNAILPGNDYQFGVNPDGDQSRGVFVKSKE